MTEQSMRIDAVLPPPSSVEGPAATRESLRPTPGPLDLDRRGGQGHGSPVTSPPVASQTDVARESPRFVFPLSGPTSSGAHSALTPTKAWDRGSAAAGMLGGGGGTGVGSTPGKMDGGAGGSGEVRSDSAAGGPQDEWRSRPPLTTAEEWRSECRFKMMEFNMGVLEAYIEQTPVRMEETRLQVAALRRRRNEASTRDEIRMGRNFHVAIEWLEQYLRFMGSGEERRLFHARMQAFLDAFARLPRERQTRDAMVDLWIRYFQLDDAEAEIDYESKCPVCRDKPFDVRRREAMMQCIHCGLMKRFLTVRSNVRLAPTKMMTPQNTGDFKQFTAFATLVSDQVESDDRIEQDPDLHRVLRKEIQQHDYLRPETAPIQTAELQRAIQRRGFKTLKGLAPKIADAMNNVRPVRLTRAQCQEVLGRLKAFQLTFILFKPRRPTLRLPSPKVAFQYICTLYRWTHLSNLFKLTVAEQQALPAERERLHAFLPLLREVDRQRVWLLPAVPVSPFRTVPTAPTPRATPLAPLFSAGPTAPPSLTPRALPAPSTVSSASARAPALSPPSGSGLGGPLADGRSH